MYKRLLYKLTVTNVQGIHIRPATELYLLSKKYPETTMIFSVGNRISYADSIGEILSLKAGYKDEVHIKIEGPNGRKLFKELKRKFSTFDQYRKERSNLWLSLWKSLNQNIISLPLKMLQRC